MFFRTDMSVERREVYKTANKIEKEIDGIDYEEEKSKDYNIIRVRITNETGEKALQRKIGEYITIDLKKINNLTIEKEDEIIKIFSSELSRIIDKHIKNIYTIINPIFISIFKLDIKYIANDNNSIIPMLYKFFINKV